MSRADSEASDSRDVAGECEPERARRKVPNLDGACAQHIRRSARWIGAAGYGDQDVVA